MIRSLLNPIFESLFHDNSHGFREGHSCHTAMEQLLTYYRQGYRVVLDADIKGFFDNIPHSLIMDLVKREVADGNILGLVMKFLQAGVMEEGILTPTRKGTPQGGVISPLLANIVLNHLDWRLHDLDLKFVRYADDFVVLFKNKRQAEEALVAIKECIEEDLGLELSPEKTHITTFGHGFNFLGFYVSARTVYMGGKAVDRFKNKIRELTVRSHNLDAGVVTKFNRVVAGTVRYFATPFTTCSSQFTRLDGWLRKRIRCMKFKRIWKTDHTRLKNRNIRRMGFLTCKEVALLCT